ncbi:MAG TPA: amidohydrolase family protein [Bryobacteraceae bacterium]|nr:amidohydrolase family protein [Bryobacteraceae bacterium]
MLNRRTFLGGLPLLAARPEPKATDVWSPPRCEVWDVHCHIFEVAGETPEARVTELVKFGDRMGIERFVLFMGFPFYTDPTPEQLRQQNDQVLRAMRAFPQRVSSFVYLNPNYLSFSLQEFDRCVRDGPMVGVKLWVAKHCNAPELDPIVERAASLKAAILQHTWLKSTGNLPGESTPFDVAELALRHPNVPLICSHVGGDWERGIRSIRGTKNVYIDVAGFDPTAGAVEMAVRELGPERILFGSDVGIRTFASQLGKVMGAEVSDSARKLILCGNLKRMLTPILKAKGRRL